MNSTESNSLEIIPANYDNYLGPMFFEPYARDIAGLFDLWMLMAVELGCGRGRVHLPWPISACATENRLRLALGDALPVTTFTETHSSLWILNSGVSKIHSGWFWWRWCLRRPMLRLSFRFSTCPILICFRMWAIVMLSSISMLRWRIILMWTQVFSEQWCSLFLFWR